MIEARNLSKTIGKKKVVHDLSFKAGLGKTTVLLGTSGSGKTTTLKMLNQLILPDEGEVFIDSIPNSSIPPHQLRRTIGYVLQETGLFPHLTVEENIGTVPKLLSWKADYIRKKTLELLEQLGLKEERFLKSYPYQLSGGQKQRVGIARALISSPPILLMDEPFGALDPINRNSIRQDLKNLPQFKKTCIVMVTHDIQEAYELGDQIILLDQGEVQQIGTKSDLIERPNNDFVRNFLKSQSLYLRFYIKPLSLYFHQFLEKKPEDTWVIGSLPDSESLEKALNLFSSDRKDEVLAIKSTNLETRFTSFKHLIQLFGENGL